MKREEALIIAKVINSSASPQKRRPAVGTEAREQQMISYAMDLVEQRLLNGTASAQETTHFLKLATSRAELEKEKIKAEIAEKQAKAKAIENGEEMKILYDNAIKAMRNYAGYGDPDEYEY